MAHQIGGEEAFAEETVADEEEETEVAGADLELVEVVTVVDEEVSLVVGDVVEVSFYRLPHSSVLLLLWQSILQLLASLGQSLIAED